MNWRENTAREMSNCAAGDAERLLGESGTLAEPLGRRRDMGARRNKQTAGHWRNNHLRGGHRLETMKRAPTEDMAR